MKKFLFGSTNWKALVQVVVVLVGIFAVLAFVPVLGHHSHHTPILRSQVQVRSLIQGAIVYAGNHDDRYPTMAEWPGALIESGIIEIEQLVSRVEDGDGVSFVYLPSSIRIFEGEFASRIIIYEDPKHYEEGVVVGFADSHVEVIKHKEFERMLADQIETQKYEP